MRKKEKKEGIVFFFKQVICSLFLVSHFTAFNNLLIKKLPSHFLFSLHSHKTTTSHRKFPFPHRNSSHNPFTEPKHHFQLLSLTFTTNQTTTTPSTACHLPFLYQNHHHLFQTTGEHLPTISTTISFHFKPPLPYFKRHNPFTITSTITENSTSLMKIARCSTLQQHGLSTPLHHSTSLQ